MVTTTLRQLLHALTEDHLDLDAPITVDMIAPQPDAAITVDIWVTMEVTGVTTRLGRDGKHVQELDLRRQDQEDER